MAADSENNGDHYFLKFFHGLWVWSDATVRFINLS